MVVIERPMIPIVNEKTEVTRACMRECTANDCAMSPPQVDIVTSAPAGTIQPAITCARFLDLCPRMRWMTPKAIV